MAVLRKQENLTVVTQNVVPQLAEIAYNNIVELLAGGNPAVPSTEFTVSGNIITWDDVAAGYNLEVGEVVSVDYEYDDGQLTPGEDVPYSPTDTTQNPVTAEYDIDVIEEGLIKDIIHAPVSNTLVVKVNTVQKTEGVDYTFSGRTITWISGTTLEVGDVVNVFYRIPA